MTKQTEHDFLMPGDAAYEDDLTADEERAFEQMTEEQIEAYWRANTSYEDMKAYLDDPETPSVVKDFLTLDGWAEHQPTS